MIGKFKDEELLPIVTDSGYHSPEFSEDDDGESTIVVRNLRWRSSTVSESIEIFCINRIANSKKKIKSCANYYFMWIKIPSKVLGKENAYLSMMSMLRKGRRQMRLIGQNQVIMGH